MAAAMQIGQLARLHLLKGPAELCRHHVGRPLTSRFYASAVSDSGSSGGVSLIQGASRGLGLEFVSVADEDLSLVW